MLAGLLGAAHVLRVGEGAHAVLVRDRDLHDEAVARRVVGDGADEVLRVRVRLAVIVDILEGEDRALTRRHRDARLREDRLATLAAARRIGEVHDERRIRHGAVAVLVAVLADGRRARQVADNRQAARLELRDVNVERVLDLRELRLEQCVSRDRQEGAPLAVELVDLSDARRVGRLVLWHL